MLHERVDDLPLLMAELQRSNLADLLNQHFPTHGNWQGLPLGEVTLGWLCHLLSEANHCLSHVQDWADERRTTLTRLLAQPVRSLDWADDRLAAVLRYFSDDGAWEAFEAALARRTLSAYALEPQLVRLDATTGSADRPIVPGGLFQRGYSKGGRPALPILKLMAATLDPLGLPLGTTLVSGEHADDPLYLPAMQQVRATLERRGILFVGDCKMGATETRATVVAAQDYYLCPLSEKQLPPADLQALLAPVWSREQATTPVLRPRPEEDPELLGLGFEVTALVTAPGPETPRTWTERRLVFHSATWAEHGRTALRGRLQQAQAALTQLNTPQRGRKRPADRAGWEAAVAQILQRQNVTGLFQITYHETTRERTIRRRGRNPARTVVETEITLTFQEDPAAIQAVERALGWRVYATNAPAARLSLTEAVLTYRSQAVIERGFARLKGHPLSLEPMYLARDEHAKGLVRLLSLAWRQLTLIEYQVRRSLAAAQAELTGLYPGNPGRRTARPTTELLLRAFRPITFVRVPLTTGEQRHLSPLTALQQQILQLLGHSDALYTILADP